MELMIKQLVILVDIGYLREKKNYPYLSKVIKKKKKKKRANNKTSNCYLYTIKLVLIIGLYKK